VRQLAAVVKAWAFARFASIDVRWKNSYAWTLMVISFLQVWFSCIPGCMLSLTCFNAFLLQSGISPPILPCIHTLLSPELLAALFENSQHEELLVTALPSPLTRGSVQYAHSSNVFQCSPWLPENGLH
jgi:hypothetical protein